MRAMQLIRLLIDKATSFVMDLKDLGGPWPVHIITECVYRFTLSSSPPHPLRF